MKLFPAVILCPWAAGLAVFAAIVRRWDAVKPSFYGTLCASAAVISAIVLAASPILPGASSGHRLIWLATTTTTTVLLGAAGIAYWFDRVFPMSLSDTALGVGAVLSTASAIAAGAAQHPESLGVARALSALLFLGSVTATMVLGHWFLVDPKLDRTAIKRLGAIFVVALPIEVASLMLKPGMIDVVGSSPGGIGGYLRGLWLADVALTALLGLGVLGALAGRGYPAVMAATGLSYLAILTAFGVDVIAKAMIGGAI